MFEDRTHQHILLICIYVSLDFLQDQLSPFLIASEAREEMSLSHPCLSELRQDIISVQLGATSY